jgi:hypothetical protein
MIRYGNIEVPRAAVAQLATKLARDATGTRTRPLGVQLGWAIDNNRDSFTIPEHNVYDVIELLERDPLPGLEPLAELLRQQVETQSR